MRKNKWSIILLVVTASIALATASQLASFSKSFNVGSGGRLVVEVAGGDILIRSTSASNIQVDVVGLDEKQLDNLEVNQSGETVTVSYRPQGNRGWWGGTSPRFEFSIPSNMNLELTTSGGDISIDEQLTGHLEGKTSGGDIKFKDVTGEVDLKTSGGDISGGVVQGNVSLATSGGDIDLAAANGETEVKTSGGDITVGEVGDHLVAKTAGGDIELGNVGGSAEVKTAGGDIAVGAVAGSATLETAGGDVELKSADGPVEARTAGGDLSLRQVAGPIQASTAGGDIYAEITKVGGETSQLKTSGGDIDLGVGSGVSATIHAVIRVSGNWARENQRYNIYYGVQSVNPLRNESTHEITADIPVGNGGPAIYLETSNGNIKLKDLSR